MRRVFLDFGRTHENLRQLSTKVSDSLEYCLADGTVLAPMDDPQATLRFEARPNTRAPINTVSSASLRSGSDVLWNSWRRRLCLYLGRTNKAAVDPGRSTILPLVQLSGTVPTTDLAPRWRGDQETQQIHSALAVQWFRATSQHRSPVADDYHIQMTWAGRSIAADADSLCTGQVRYDSVTAPIPIVEMNKD